MDKNVKLGVALSGGGLQFFSHIGALKALEKLGIEIDYISGTSTGSMIAGLYAIGLSTSEIQDICISNYQKIIKMKKRIVLKAIFNYIRKKQTNVEGLIDGVIVENLINEEAKKKNISLISDVISKKLAIATVDTKSMKECILLSEKIKSDSENIDYISNINVGKAVRASMAFPGIFTTVNFENYNFIDGGTVNNLPTKVLKDMGANKVLSIGFDTSKYTVTNNVENVLIRALDIFSNPNVKNSEKLSDIAIKIYNSDTSLLKVKEVERTIANGYDAIMDRKEEILSLLEV